MSYVKWVWLDCNIRVSGCLLVVFVGSLLGSVGIVSAAPMVAFKAKAVPIAGFPHTGNILGAGAVIEGDFEIEGKEYNGLPSPLIGVSLFMTLGMKVRTAGFWACREQTLEVAGPAACPRSSAGPPGKAEGIEVSDRIPVAETLTIEPFLAPVNGLDVDFLGSTPESIRILSPGSSLNPPEEAGFGPETSFEVPIVRAAPNASDLSIERLVTKFGSARRRGRRVWYTTTMPKRCHQHHFAFRAQLTFAKNGDLAAPFTVTRTYRSPCPLPRSSVDQGL